MLNGPVDRGGRGDALLVTESPSLSAQFSGGSTADLNGAGGALFSWPIVPIHLSLLPDGRVMSYGTDEMGRQGAAMVYAVWNPRQGTTFNSHVVLAHMTGTDLFCASGTLLPSTGELLLTGGDRSVNGVRNYGVNDVNLFSPVGDRFRPAPSRMEAQRWYPTLVTSNTGEVVTMGGLSDIPLSDTLPPTVPNFAEVYSTGTWRSLTSARSIDALGTGNWYYPRAWWAPNGKGVFIAAHHGGMYWLNPSGAGSLAQASGNIGWSADYYPSIMYERGKILSVRNENRVVSIDINGREPVTTPAPSLPAQRMSGSMAMLADGQVALTGGSAAWNTMTGAQYNVLLWNPGSQSWRVGAALQKARLYHSTSMLLPDATLLVAGGGAPGPETNLNAEIYYPPYLFVKDGSGRLAPRPVIQSLPREGVWGQRMMMNLGESSRVSRVTMVHTGSPTHGWDADARFLRVETTRQKGQQIQITMPPNANVAPPGYYMIFAFDQQGVPSHGWMMRLR